LKIEVVSLKRRRRRKRRRSSKRCSDYRGGNKFYGSEVSRQCLLVLLVKEGRLGQGRALEPEG
jgi:hypothetical protein